MAEAARALSPERRQRILDAAMFLALRHGLRGVTMEAIAREARVAKPTLYGYFPDKEAVFEGVMSTIVLQLRAAFDGAMAGDAPLLERIAAGLTAKYQKAADVLAGSPHATELYGAHDRMSAPSFAALEEHIRGRISGELAAAGVADSDGLVTLLLAATFGIGSKAGPGEDIGPAVGLLVRRLVGPELGQ